MKTILIVEDNAASAEMLEQVVYKVNSGIRVRRASSFEEAYMIAAKSSISLFLIDIILKNDNPGDISGLRFADAVRGMRQYRHTPIIFVTGLEDPQLYAYSELHCYYYIEKPYDLEKAERIIEEALEIPSAGSEQSVFFRKDGIFYKRNISEVMYIENTRGGQTVHFTDGDIQLQYKPCKVILEELNSEKMVQCSRNAIINVDFIDYIDSINRLIKLRGREEQIEIGIRFKKKFLENVLED